MAFPEGAVQIPTTEEGGVTQNDYANAGMPDTQGTFSQYSKQPALSVTGSLSFGNAITKGLPGLGVGLLDTLGQSIGVLKDETVPAMLESNLGGGPNSFSDFYIANRPQLRMGGEIVGMALPGLGAMKLLKTVKLAREAGSLGKALQSSRALDLLLGNSVELTAMEAKIAQEATAGNLASGVWAGKTVATPAMIAAKRGYYAARAIDAARTSIAFELGNRAAFNSSDTFYPADYTLGDQAKWFGIGTAGFVGVEMIQAKYAVRNLVQAALKASPASETLSPYAKNISDVLFRPNDRGVGVTQYAALKSDLMNTSAISSNAVLKTNLAQDQVNIKAVLSKQIDLMGYDTHVILPRTKLDETQIKLGLDALDKNPTSFLFAKKLANVPEEGQADFFAGLKKKVDDARREFDVATFAASNEADLEKQNALMATARAKLQPFEEAGNEVHYVIENDGRANIYQTRADNFLDNHTFASIKPITYNQEGLNSAGQKVNMKRMKLVVKADNEITLHDDFRAELPKGATPNDFSALYAAGAKLIKNWKPVEGQQFILTPQLPWRTVEMTLANAEVNPAASQLIKLGEGFISIDDAKFWVVDQKLRELNSLMPDTASATPKSGLAPAVQEYAPLTPENTPVIRLGGRELSIVQARQLSRADKLNDFPILVFDTRDSSGYKGIFSTKQQAETFINNSENKFLDYATPKELERWNATGPESNAYNEQQLRLRLNAALERVKPSTANVNSPLLQRIKSARQNYTPAQVIQRLNLPEPVGLTASPIVELAAHMKLQGMKSLDEMLPKADSLLPANYSQMDMLQAHLRETAGLAADAKAKIPVDGVLLKQTDTKPLFVASNGAPLLSHSDAMISGLVQAKRDVQLERLANIKPNDAPLVSSIIRKILTDGPEGGELSGAANQARAVQTLHDGLASGQGQLVYQDRINDQFPTMKAVQLVAQNGDKFTDNYVSALAEQRLTPRLAQILAPKNHVDLFDANRIEQAYRSGWDIARVEPSPSGQGFVFRLAKDSKINAQLFEKHFGGEVSEFMPDMSVTALKAGYSPLQISKSAADMMQAISDMSRQSGMEDNALRIAEGRNPIKIRDFHLPTPELSREGTWFVKNNLDEVIHSFFGDTENANRNRALEAAQKLSKATGESHTAISLETVHQEYSIGDKTFMNVINYSDQHAKSGIGIKGGLGRTEIDTGDKTLRAMVKTLQQQYLNIGIRARAIIFEPELNYARQAAAMAPRDKLSGINIFDRYIATMFSRNPTNAKGSIGKIYGGIESGMDAALSWLNAHYAEAGGSEAATLGAKTMRTLLRKQSSEEEFRQFQKDLPKWSPFQDANAWAESTFKEKMPWTSRPVMAKLSRVTSTLALRFLDQGMALMNFAGLMSNTGSVIKMMRQLPGEDFDTWISRTAAWGTKLSDNVVSFSASKAMRNVSKAYWAGELDAPMADAAAHGYFLPEYASLGRAIAQPSGSKAAAFDLVVRKASMSADNSEMFVRKMAWGMGYKIGKDMHGFTDDRNAYIFANNFVNEMVGNYSPNNKPAMFSGAVGLPLGAFQTYMFNLYRRLYGLVERGDRAALLTQYATQASMFGAQSVPGYGLWNSMMTADNNGADDFSSRVSRTTGYGISELLLNGSLSGIPAIFGQDSLALYKRNSYDMTSLPPTIADWQRAPPIQFLASVYDGTVATINNIFKNSSFSLQQQEEILARFSTNRALKNIMEMAANAKTDKRGNVVEQGTRDFMHVAAALAASVPSHTARLQDAYNKERTVQLSQADARATLNDKTRALFRGGNFDISDLQNLVHGYVNAGGNPAYLGQWFRNNYITSMTPAAQTKMEELGRSGKLTEFENMLVAMQHNQAPN